MSTENLPATRAQLQAMRDLSIPFDLDHLPTFDDAARLIREAEEAENPMRVAMGPPVRDIREAMHPAMSPGMAKADTLTEEERAVYLAGYHGPERSDGVSASTPDPAADGWLTLKLDPSTLSSWSTVHVQRPHVATLPDGTRVNLPAGTVLREGEVDEPTVGAKPFPMPGTVWRWLGDPRFDPHPSGPHVVASLRWFHGQAEVVFDGGESCAGVQHLMGSAAWEHVSGLRPNTIERARDLLQRARVPLTASEDDDTPALLTEIAAFLAGASPPEHPVIALVRSFVGKPGDKPGPVWMHDALGRDVAPPELSARDGWPAQLEPGMVFAAEDTVVVFGDRFVGIWNDERPHIRAACEAYEQGFRERSDPATRYIGRLRVDIFERLTEKARTL